MKVVIAGANGFLGGKLAERLVAAGHEVVGLVRDTSGGASPGARLVGWRGNDPDGAWVAELDGADALVNLTGKPIATRPTRGNVDALVESRVQPIVTLGEAIGRVADPPAVWVQTAAVGIFGDAGDAELTEATTPSGIGPDELVRTCLAWEHAFEQVSAAAGVERRVLLRTGVVLGGGDPTTAALLPLLRLRLGGASGSGKQWLSWVAVDDVVGVIERALGDTSFAGTYHLTSPNPVRNEEMMRAFRHAAGTDIGLPAPKPAVIVGAWLRGAPPSLVLASQRALPQRLLDAGYRFAGTDFATVATAAVAAHGGDNDGRH